MTHTPETAKQAMAAATERERVLRDAVLGDDAPTVHAVRALADQLDRHDYPDDAETCRGAADLIERQAAVIAAKDEELARCGRENCFGRDEPGLKRWVRASRLEDAEAQLAALQQMPEDLAGLCERLEDRIAGVTQFNGEIVETCDEDAMKAAQVIRAMVAREAAVRGEVEAAIADSHALENEPGGVPAIERGIRHGLKHVLAILNKYRTQPGVGGNGTTGDEAVDRAARTQGEG